MRRLISFKFLLTLFLIILFSFTSYKRNSSFYLQGNSIGTVWRVIIPSFSNRSINQALLQKSIIKELALINNQMSTWKKDSHLSKFNNLHNKVWFLIPRELAIVTLLSLNISEKSKGAFDITILPLVNLWGFGIEITSGILSTIPAWNQVAKTLKLIGSEKLSVQLKPPSLRKDITDLHIDLSAIAKGYAVDRIASLLMDLQIRNYLVEIGGELRFAGRNNRGTLWNITIEHPDENRKPLASLQVPSGAIATSGNYRNYIKFKDQKLTHIIDPRRGYPIQHQLVSVTVIANDCATADAWATALMVLGEEQGLYTAEKAGISAWFSIRHDEGLHNIITSTMYNIIQRVHASSDDK